MTNIIIIVLTIIALFGALFFMWRRAKGGTNGNDYDSELNMDKLFSIVKTTLADMVKEESVTGLTEAELDNGIKRRARINDALKKCVYGIETAKIIVIDLIRNIISTYLTNEEEVLNVINFNTMFLDVRIKFEILLYRYKKEYKKDALAEIIKKYNWKRIRYDIEDKTKPHYRVDEMDVNDAFVKENIHLDYEEMLDIIAILIYQRYKGFGIVDTIDEMNINGFNFGTSGSILSALATREVNKQNKATSSFWLYFQGIYIHFKFLNFGSEEEVRRVVQLIARYNSPGPLTEKRGFIVNTMQDKSRVLAVRPPLAEYWAVFVRKFSLSDPSLKGLVEKEYTKRADLGIGWVKYLMMGQVTTAFTGRQGSGKTTMMTAAFEYVDPRYNIRVIEMAPEMYLRELYPERNILSLQETLTVTATMAQDALKKSDAAVTVVGEVATDEIAANMIQAAQIASLYTLFSHHANKGDDLIFGIRNSLVNAKGYDMKTAEAQVLQVIHMNVHLNYGTTGKRFIERVTEIIPLAERTPYPDYNEADPHSFNKITIEYYKRITDRQTFICRDLLRYNQNNDTYEVVNTPSENLLKHMLNSMPSNEVDGFMKFIEQNYLRRGA